MIPSKSYIPLARKYRPATFSELVGQDATAMALGNAIKLGREPHAVIFSGVRGIGKTTSARLYAKALNCDKALSPEPCNQCESCQAIAQGIHEDVIEIDGASNTGVDDVRALRETITYVPQRSRFKVYIIDEVHMLSQSAFNALLKTLEEPPAHVVFIFATTELHKIPQTIMSRCQTFHLQRLNLTTIRDRIRCILESENIPFDDKAVVAIAREGHGSMRDALTLLDHVIAFGEGNVTVAALEKIISHVSSTNFLALLEALVTRSPEKVISILDEMEQSGVSMQDVAEKTAAVARHGFVARDVGSDHVDFRALGLDDEETRRLNEIARKAGPADLNRIFRTLAKSRSELDGSVLDRYIIENYCLEWCLDPGILLHASVQSAPGSKNPTSQPASAAKTMANIRESLQVKPVTTPQSQAAEITGVQTAIAKEAQAKIETTGAVQVKSEADSSQTTALEAATKTMPATWRELVEIWKKHKPLQAKRLEDVHPVTYSANKIELVIPSESFLSAALLKPDEQKKLKDAFNELFGFNGTISFTGKKGAVASDPEKQPVLPETLAVIQQRESAEKRDKIATNAQNNPITQDALNLFNATIESIEVNP